MKLTRRIRNAVRHLQARSVWLRECVASRLRSLTAEPERGSESVEKAIITAIVLAVALGLGAAITAVVHKYQGKIR